jgi:hypothetical protein
VRDTGWRNASEPYRMKAENIEFERKHDLHAGQQNRTR